MENNEYLQIRKRLTSELLAQERLVNEAGAALQGPKSEFLNGVLILTSHRLLFGAEEAADSFELSLAEILSFSKSKKLGFPYLNVGGHGVTFSFLLAKEEIAEFLSDSSEALKGFGSQGAGNEASGKVQDDFVNLGGVFDPDRLEAKSKQSRTKALELQIERLESTAPPVFFSFVADSSDGQGAGEIPLLAMFISRGWRLENMSVIASDVAPGMRETHILVSWSGKN